METLSPIKKQLAELYLDYLNNYLTIDKFSEHNGLSFYHSELLIDLGRDYHQEMVEHEQRRKLNKGTTINES